MRALAKKREDRYQSAREMQGALEEFVREGRIGASRTGLSAFMGSLFAEKLVDHTAALLQDKVLADSVAVGALETLDVGATGAIESGRPWSLGPMASRTVTDARIPSAPSRTAIVLGALALLVLVGTATRASLSSRPAAAALDAPAPAAPARDRGVIAIASSPPGASIFVNGERSPRTTPATLTNLALGAPCVVEVKAEGYEPVSQSVTLTDRDPSSAISVVLEPQH